MTPVLPHETNDSSPSVLVTIVGRVACANPDSGAGMLPL